jgi:hypothetical protein
MAGERVLSPASVISGSFATLSSVNDFGRYRSPASVTVVPSILKIVSDSDKSFNPVSVIPLSPLRLRMARDRGKSFNPASVIPTLRERISALSVLGKSFNPTSVVFVSSMSRNVTDLGMSFNPAFHIERKESRYSHQLTGWIFIKPPEGGTFQPYGRVHWFQDLRSDMKFKVESKRREPWLPLYRITFHADDHSGLLPEQLFAALEVIPEFKLSMIEIAFDFDASMNRTPLKQRILFGKSRPVESVETTRHWGCQKEANL